MAALLSSSLGLLLEDARRINSMLRYYRIMLASLPALFVGLLVTKYWAEYIPWLYGPVPIVDMGASVVGTHLAGTMVFALIGFRKVSVAWVCVWFATLTLVCATQSWRDLAVVLPVVFAMFVLGRFRLMLTTVAAGVAILAVLLTLEATFGEYSEARDSTERPVSAHQIVENMKSIIGQSGQQAEGTKQWRLNWWDIIINDTIHGDQLLDRQGIRHKSRRRGRFRRPTGNRRGPRSPTRSPHSAHMTLLARAGIPGLVLWALVARVLVWHADESDTDGARSRTRTMGRPVPVHRLLCLGDRYQRDVRCRARRSNAGHLVLVPVRLRPRVCDDLSGSVLQRISPGAVHDELQISGFALGRDRSLAMRISDAVALSALLILVSSASDAAAVAGVTDVPCPPDAIAVEPGASIQAAVDSAGNGAVFCLKNGMHRAQAVRPRSRQRFYGEGRSVLNGSRLLTDFNREGRLLGGERPIAARPQAWRVCARRARVRSARRRVHRR